MSFVPQIAASCSLSAGRFSVHLDHLEQGRTTTCSSPGWVSPQKTVHLAFSYLGPSPSSFQELQVQALPLTRSLPVWEETVSRGPCTGIGAWKLLEDIANCGGQQQETQRGIRQQNEYSKPGKHLLVSWIWNGHTGWCTVKHVLSHDFRLFLPFFLSRKTMVHWWYITLGCERHTALFFFSPRFQQQRQQKLP